MNIVMNLCLLVYCLIATLCLCTNTKEITAYFSSSQ